MCLVWSAERFTYKAFPAALALAWGFPIAGLMVPLPGIAQPTTGRPAATAATPSAFDVISVKPNKDGPGLMTIRPMPGGQTHIARNVPLRLTIKAMYRITDAQIIGGEAWIDTERYDIDAKADRSATLDQMHAMFRNLLADRFQLRFHREARLASAYVLTVRYKGFDVIPCFLLVAIFGRASG
jgi:hypothetical protein